MGCCEGVTVGRRCGGERGEGGGSYCHWLLLCLKVHQEFPTAKELPACSQLKAPIFMK